MKNIFILLLFFLLTTAEAQKNAFKANPLALAFGAFEVSYEMMNEKKSSSELVFGYLINKTDNQKLTAYAFEIRYKFLLSKELKSFEGYYLAPIGNLINGQVQFDNYQTPSDISIVGIGALGGYQFIFQNENDKGFVIDINAGFVNNFVSSRTIDVSKIKGLIPRIGISLGYAF